MRSEKLIGLPVVHIEQGKQYGIIQGIVLNDEQKCVAGFVMRAGGWRKRRLLAIHDVYAMGEQAVTITQEDALQDLNGDSPLHQAWNGALSLLRMNVLTTTGIGLGTVHDYQFSPDGAITNLVLRPAARPRHTTITLAGHFLRSFGKDAVIVEDEAKTVLVQEQDAQHDDEKKQETDQSSTRFLRTLTNAFTGTASSQRKTKSHDNDERQDEHASQ